MLRSDVDGLDRTTRARMPARPRAGLLLEALAILAPLLLVLAVACDDRPRAPDTAATPAPEIADHECAACGMLVRDQPAPRAWTRHRDGTEAFTCSVGDLLVYLSAPSPHGHVTAVQVEVMQPDEDPALRDTHAHAWVPAEAAWYVVGVQRRGVMGAPVLVYAERRAADAAAGAYPEAHVVDFDGLQTWWRARQR